MELPVKLSASNPLQGGVRGAMQCSLAEHMMQRPQNGMHITPGTDHKQPAARSRAVCEMTSGTRGAAWQAQERECFSLVACCAACALVWAINAESVRRMCHSQKTRLLV